MVQFISHEFLETIKAVENKTGWNVSFHYFDTCIELSFAHPEDETGELDVEFYIQWYEMDKKNVEQLAQYISDKFQQLKNDRG